MNHKNYSPNNIINAELKNYITKNILPRYNTFDGGHNINHIQKVIDESLILAQQFDVNTDMVYAIAAYHDIGIEKSREEHHIVSGEILCADENLKKWFSTEQITIMQQAVEDHRASNKNEPRSIYGKIVAEADRDISLQTILRRTIQFGLKKYPNENFDFQFDRAYQHLVDKYGENGYLKLHLHSQKNERGLIEVRAAIADKEKLRSIANVIMRLMSKCD
ncbi:MAG: HD domain-containing protein [Prevotellaceae bacterium]|nr:HD domain-containing protein [Prevotellaceae bacterium]